jgi:hypothetical protein
MIKYLVSADHVAPEYTFKDYEVKVHHTGDNKYFATAPKLGCGKDFSTPEEAAKYLFLINACTNIRLIKI